MFKKATSGVLGSLSCSRTVVRSARQIACGLACGRARLGAPGLGGSDNGPSFGVGSGQVLNILLVISDEPFGLLNGE